MSLAQFHFDPDTYSAVIREELPVYDQIQDAVGNATADRQGRRILDLGAGTGATARPVQQHHPNASFVLLDESPGMLATAKHALAKEQIEQTVVGDLSDPIPDGPFDLVVSALAIHHLPGVAKRDLFVQIRSVLSASGRFVVADVVVPADPADAVTPLSEGYDHPSSLPELTGWLDDAGFTAAVTWRWKDIAVLGCDPTLADSTPSLSARLVRAGDHGASTVAASCPRGTADSVDAMTLRAVGVASCALLVLGLGSTVSAGASAKPPASPTVWFLTNQDRVGRAQPGAPPKVYDNPLRCAVGEDDCNLRGIAATPGALWIPDATNGLRRIDPTTGRPANTKNGDRYSSAPTVWDGRLWFTAVDRLLGVRPPATEIATRVAFSKTYAEAVAASPHYLWIAGSGQTRSAPAGVRRMDRSGHVQDIDLPISGDLSVVIGALDDHTAYVVASPTSPDPNPPSRLFRIATTSGGTRVDDLGPLAFGPGAIVPVGNKLWLNDVNAPRLVALSLDGHPAGQTDLTVPGDGQLVGASGRLWYVGSPDSGGSVMDLVDPASGSIVSTIPVTLPGTDRIGAFTIAG